MSGLLALSVGDEAVRSASRRALERAGFRVVEADTGLGALELASAAWPDLVLLGTALPDMRSAELDAEIRRHRPEALILHLTDEDPACEVQGPDRSCPTAPISAGALAAVAQALARAHGAEEALRRSEERSRASPAPVDAAGQGEDEILKRSEERFRTLADTIPQLAWMADGNGQIFWFNQRWYDYTGMSGPADRASRAHLIHPDHHRRVSERFLACIASGEPWEDSFPLLGGDGRYRWFLSRARPIQGSQAGERMRWFGTNTDITSQRDAEAALAEETHTLETLNQTAALLSAELDLDRLVQIATDAGVELTGAQFGAFFYNVVAEAGESYMLYTLSGVSREAFDRFPMPRNTAVFAPTFKGEGVIRSADITKDPRYGHNSPYNGMPEGHLPVRSYLAVPVISRSGSALGGLFFGHSSPGVFGERAERIMAGIAAQAAVAIDNAQLFAASQRELAERRRAEAALQELNEALEQRVVERTVQLHAEVAERRQAEEALRQAQKMEAIGQLTGGVAHDFNNLLTAITGNIELLQRRLAAGKTDVARFADSAMTSAKRAATLTQRLLAFSRRQALAPKSVDLNRLVSGMEELIRRTVGESIRVETAPAEALWPTWCDPNQMENALLNLAINARDAMPEGGLLTIETANARIDPATASIEDDLEAGDYVLLSVSDTGQGMSPQVLARAFDPFFTTKPIGQGTGLGLSQLYGFTKQSGGHARIYSEEGRGTSVKIYLPRRQAAEAVHEPALLPAEPVREVRRAAPNEAVLVVEDEALVRGLVVQTLADAGFRVSEAADAKEALLFLESGQPVDLLVTDVGLPGANGRQLAEMARRLRSGLKVLFMTGYAHNAAVSAADLEEGMELISKPFAIDMLARRVEAMLGD